MLVAFLTNIFCKKHRKFFLSWKAKSNADAPTYIHFYFIFYLCNDKMVAFQEGSYSMDQEFDGKGLTPYDPDHNSTYLLAGEYDNNYSEVISYRR